jgi:anaerobic selenocysteine-containing dehydrogenase
MGKMTVTRRNFLASAGAAGAVWLHGCDPAGTYSRHKNDVPGAAGWRAGEEKQITSVCGQCPAGCGIRVRVVEGRAVKIEGHPEYPLNRGGCGPKGQAGLQMLYHPDRIKGPMRRDGPRGSGRWKPVPWDEVITELADNLRTLRDGGGASEFMVLDGEPRGLMPEIWERFLTAFGSPNHVGHRAATDGGRDLAMQYMQGVPEIPAFDWSRTRYVLAFGAGLFESSCQTMHFLRATGRQFRSMPGRRAKLALVSSRHSLSASQADEWIPIEPATEGALALGLAHVLLSTEKVDREFLKEHTTGLDDWTGEDGVKHRGFSDLVLKDYPPERVASITGVPVDIIERLAAEMADNRPTIVLADESATSSTNGFGSAMAIHALNGLLGNIEQPGGVLVQRDAPLKAWSEFEPDETALAGLEKPRVDGAGTTACPLGRSRIQAVPEAILAGTPYPVSALFLYRSNPVFSKPDGAKWVEALRKVPLVVGFSPLMDESVFWADFVLPDHTYLERWEIVEPVPGLGRSVVGLRKPVVKPLHDTMPTGDVVIRLAKEIGETVAEGVAWKNYRIAVLRRLKGLLRKEGSTSTSKLSVLGKGMSRDAGWWGADVEFEDWELALRTDSGRFEFYSAEIATRLAAAWPDDAAREAALEKAGLKTRGDALCLPHWEPPVFLGDAGQYPLVLLPYRTIGHAEGGARHLPWLRELPAQSSHGRWVECIDVNPRDGTRLGLADGDRAIVESPVAIRNVTSVRSTLPKFRTSTCIHTDS